MSKPETASLCSADRKVAGVAPSFKEPECEILGRTEAGGNEVPEETAAVKELGNHVGNLQQEVKDLG